MVLFDALVLMLITKFVPNSTITYIEGADSAFFLISYAKLAPNLMKICPK